MNKMKYGIMMSPFLLVALALGISASATPAWGWVGCCGGGGEGGGGGNWGVWQVGQGCCGSGGYGYGYGYGQAYYAGQQDAQYDQQNGLAYNPVGSCVPCHSPDYWNNFRQGYDSVYQQQNQEQKSTQGAAINIYGNNNYASIGQSNSQGQSALSGLPHLIGQGLCNLGISQSCGYEVSGSGGQGGYGGGQGGP
jgi:hypothetical protein